MFLFVLALAVALLGVGAYDLYNPGTRDVTMAGYHFVAVPDWMPVAAGAGVPLTLFLLSALWTGLRIRLLKRATRRAAAWAGDGDWELVTQPAPRVERPAVQPPPAPAAARRRRASQAPPPLASPQPAPKKSWLPPD
jgi:hypothetical protein